MVEIIKCAPGQSGYQQTNRVKQLKSMASKRCFYDGQEFESLQALAKHLGVTNQRIYHARKKGEFNGKALEVYK